MLVTLYYNHYTTAEPGALFGVSADSPVHENTPWSVARHLWRRLQQVQWPRKKESKIHEKKQIQKKVLLNSNISSEKIQLVIWSDQFCEIFINKKKIYQNPRVKDTLELHTVRVSCSTVLGGCAAHSRPNQKLTSTY